MTFCDYISAFIYLQNLGAFYLSVCVHDRHIKLFKLYFNYFLVIKLSTILAGFFFTSALVKKEIVAKTFYKANLLSLLLCCCSCSINVKVFRILWRQSFVKICIEKAWRKIRHFKGVPSSSVISKAAKKCTHHLTFK